VVLQLGGWARVTNNPSLLKSELIMKCYMGPWTNSLKWPRQQKIDMTFGRWNISCLYRADSIETVMRKLEKYTSDLEGYKRLDGTRVAVSQL
jgi:hypothetical protein